MPNADEVPTVDGSPIRPDDVVLDLLFDADNLSVLRARVASAADLLGLTGEAVADLVLVAHELACNAVRHGGANPSEPGHLLLWRDGDAVVCQVNDNGPGFAGLDVSDAGRHAVPASANNGRGLWITRQVVRQLTINTSTDGTTITVSMPLR